MLGQDIRNRIVRIGYDCLVSLFVSRRVVGGNLDGLVDLSWSSIVE